MHKFYIRSLTSSTLVGTRGTFSPTHSCQYDYILRTTKTLYLGQLGHVARLTFSFILSNFCAFIGLYYNEIFYCFFWSHLFCALKRLVVRDITVFMPKPLVYLVSKQILLLSKSVRIDFLQRDVYFLWTTTWKIAKVLVCKVASSSIFLKICWSFGWYHWISWQRRT